MTQTDAAPEEKAPSRAKRINEWVAVIAGVLGILVTGLSIFGINQSNAKDEATATAEDLQGELDAANNTIGDLRSDNNQLQQDLSATESDNQKLQAEIESLREQLESVGATPLDSPSAGATPTPSEPVRHSGEVTLAENGDQIDLNAPSTDDLWEGDGSVGYDFAELYEGQLRLYSVDSLPLQGKTADYQTCSTSSGYGGGDGTGYTYYDPASLRGDRCFRLESDRFASITFVRADGDRMTFAVTTWENED
jgi:TolA-binding protein